MSQQNRTSVRDRKSDETKREVANSNDRYPRNNREAVSNDRQRSEVNYPADLDPYRLNDLYERSSI